MENNFLLGVMLLFIVGCGKLTDKQIVKKEAKQSITDTLSIVQQIDNYKKTVESKEIELKYIQRDIYESSEGGFIKIFYNEVDTLKKEIVYFGETGRKNINIYQKQGRPILIEDKEISYKNPIYVDVNIEVKDSVINVFYLDDNQKLVFWTKNRKKVPILDYNDKEVELISDYY